MCNADRRRLPGSVTAVLTIMICIVFAFPSCAARLAATAPQPEDHGAALCRSFLSSYGWRTEDFPAEVSCIRIPERFNAVFSAYNELQRSQGFDFAPYRGKIAVRYVFRLSGYPDTSNTEDVRATVYVYNAEVIGGDISSVALDGFMHGIVPEE